MPIEPQNPEVNFYPIVGLDSVTPTVTSPVNPQPNTPVVQTSESNVIPTGGGSVLKGGTLQSPNFSKSNSGWQINADGNVEFNDGTFRGALVANSLDIPDTTTADSFHVDTSGNAWWGAST